MAVMINIDMPKTCEDCQLEHIDENEYGDVMGYSCPLIYKGCTNTFRTEARHEKCPLIDIPVAYVPQDGQSKPVGDYFYTQPNAYRSCGSCTKAGIPSVCRDCLHNNGQFGR